MKNYDEHRQSVPMTLVAGDAPIKTYGVGRRCGCGGILSRFNSQKACGPCARRITLAGGDAG